MQVHKALGPIRRILVGEKPTAHRRQATELAISVARTLRADVRVVEVERRHPLLERLGIPRAPRSSQGHFDARRTPAELADLHGFPADRLEVVHREGRARDVLLAEAESWGAHLVVIGRQSADTLPRIVLGTVTGALVRHISCPLLISRGSAYPPRSVLLPVDLSDSSAEAAACGLSLLSQTRASAARCRAVLVLPAAAGDLAIPAARQELVDFLAFIDSEATPIESGVQLGEPAPTILSEARRAQDDLIVLGTHGDGAGPIERHKVGSVVAPVLFDAPCNVLLVPPAAQLGAEFADAVLDQTAPRFEDS